MRGIRDRDFAAIVRFGELRFHYYILAVFLQGGDLLVNGLSASICSNGFLQ